MSDKKEYYSFGPAIDAYFESLKSANPYDDLLDYVEGCPLVECPHCGAVYAAYEDDCGSLDCIIKQGEKEIEEKEAKEREKYQKIADALRRLQTPKGQEENRNQARQADTGSNGDIYLIEGSGLYKIGISKNVDKRLSGLQAQSPIKLNLVHHFYSKHYRLTERWLHKLFAPEREHGEWFALTPDQIKWFCSLENGSFDTEPIPQYAGREYPTAFLS